MFECSNCLGADSASTVERPVKRSRFEAAHPPAEVASTPAELAPSPAVVAPTLAVVAPTPTEVTPAQISSSNIYLDNNVSYSVGNRVDFR